MLCWCPVLFEILRFWYQYLSWCIMGNVCSSVLGDCSLLITLLFSFLSASPSWKCNTKSVECPFKIPSCGRKKQQSKQTNSDCKQKCPIIMNKRTAKWKHHNDCFYCTATRPDIKALMKSFCVVVWFTQMTGAAVRPAPLLARTPLSGQESKPLRQMFSRFTASQLPTWTHHFYQLTSAGC